MPFQFSLVPIGRVVSSRSQPLDDRWDEVTSQIVLDRGQLDPSAITGLTDFSHIEVVFVFDRVDTAEIETAARHPRGNPRWPSVGILAQRAKNRPNRIGITCCALTGVDGLTVTVRGLDAIDGTPVLDIKPYMEQFAPRGTVRQPAWSHELMRDYW